MSPGPHREGADPEPSARIPPYLRVPPSSPAPATGPPVSPAPEPTAPAPAGPRPFVLTSGRVDGGTDIGLETQVTARPGGRVGNLAPELQAIVAMCTEPISVAEISAQLRLHLGVTKILVSDLHLSGHLDVHVLDLAASPISPETILRVMHGLRAIS